MTIGKLIQEWRQKIGMTQEELAEALELARSTVGDQESDRNSPTVETLLRYIALFEQHWEPFGAEEDERLLRFFVGPIEGELIVAKRVRTLGAPKASLSEEMLETGAGSANEPHPLTGISVDPKGRRVDPTGRSAKPVDPKGQRGKG